MSDNSVEQEGPKLSQAQRDAINAKVKEIRGRGREPHDYDPDKDEYGGERGDALTLAHLKASLDPSLQLSARESSLAAVSGEDLKRASKIRKALDTNAKDAGEPGVGNTTAAAIRSEAISLADMMSAQGGLPRGGWVSKGRPVQGAMDKAAAEILERTDSQYEAAKRGEKIKTSVPKPQQVPADPAEIREIAAAQMGKPLNPSPSKGR